MREFLVIILGGGCKDRVLLFGSAPRIPDPCFPPSLAGNFPKSGNPKINPNVLYYNPFDRDPNGNFGKAPPTTGGLAVLHAIAVVLQSPA